jgi:hypothetical protein
MASNYNKRVVSIRPASIAMLQGTFAAIAGLAAAIIFSLGNAIDIADSTTSLLGGLTLGIAAGALSIIVVPLVYFGIGWVVGFVQGLVLNFLIETSGGIEVKLEDNK